MKKEIGMTGILRLATALTALIVFTVPAPAAILLDRIVAVVDKEAITWSELYREMDFELSDRLSGLSPEQRREELKRHERDFLEMLIERKLQLREARRLNIGVSEEEVKTAVNRIRMKYGLSEEEFLDALAKEGFTLEDYKKKVSEQIVLSKLVNLEVRSKVTVTEAEIDDYIEAESGRLDTPEGYRLRQILFPAVTEQEKERAEEKAAVVMKLLEAGEPFGAVASRFSEGPYASSGGDLGFIRKKDIAREFLDVLEGLEAGEYSEPFWSDSGLHIILLEEKRLAPPPGTLREKARRVLMEEKMRKALKGYLQGLKSKASIEVKL